MCWCTGRHLIDTTLLWSWARVSFFIVISDVIAQNAVGGAPAETDEMLMEEDLLLVWRGFFFYQEKLLWSKSLCSSDVYDQMSLIKTHLQRPRPTNEQISFVLHRNISRTTFSWLNFKKKPLWHIQTWHTECRHLEATHSLCVHATACQAPLAL